MPIATGIHDLAYVGANGEERPLTLPGDAGIVREMLASLPNAKLLASRYRR